MFKYFHIVEKLDDAKNHNVVDATSLIRCVALGNGAKEITNPIEIFDDEETIIFSCGGDGTMLHACRLGEKTGALVFGISLGNLGFLTAFTKHDIETWCTILFDKSHFDRMFRSKAKIESRWLLKIKGTDHIALNDFIIAPRGSEGVMDYDIWINGNHVGEHRASNLVISTPTGSTAYSLNSGGCLISPELKLMQVLHVSPASFSSRPLVVDGNSEIRVRINKTKYSTPVVRADGQNCLEASDFIIESAFNAKLLLPNNWCYYDVLRTKLGWNKHFI